MSLVEALTNVVVGYVAAVLTQLFVFPVFGLAVTLSDSVALGAAFTIVSIARSYLLRRFFEKLKRRSPQSATAARRGAAAPRTSEVD